MVREGDGEGGRWERREMVREGDVKEGDGEGGRWERRRKTTSTSPTTSKYLL